MLVGRDISRVDDAAVTTSSCPGLDRATPKQGKIQNIHPFRPFLMGSFKLLAKPGAHMLKDLGFRVSGPKLPKGPVAPTHTVSLTCQALDPLDPEPQTPKP